MSREYIALVTAPKTFRDKPVAVRETINQVIHAFYCLGLPLDGLTARRLEKMAIAVLAIVDVTRPDHWSRAKDRLTPRSLQTREVIRYWRKHFGETISDGSYDDVRRKDLLLPYLSGMIVTDDPNKDTNDGTRRYALNPDFSELMRKLGAVDWDILAARFVQKHGTLADQLLLPRNLQRTSTSIVLPNSDELAFLGGPHNRLQKAIVEEFLPRFGYGAEVLYIGDTAKKYSYVRLDRLKELSFFDLMDAKLPDIVAYSKSRNWVYLIEAVHSANPISRERRLVLSQLLKDCKAGAVYVTAFLDKACFRKFAPDIAWETEVWIASEPDHLIHFNGDKFLGPFA